MPSLRRSPSARASWRACVAARGAFRRGDRLARRYRGRPPPRPAAAWRPRGARPAPGRPRPARRPPPAAPRTPPGRRRPAPATRPALRRGARSRPGPRRREERAVPTWPLSRASPSRRSAMARAASGGGAPPGPVRVRGRRGGRPCPPGRARPPPGAASSSASCSRTRAASRSSSSGSRPRRSSGGVEVALFTRASASEIVPRTRSASWDSSYQICWARWRRGASLRTSSSRSASRRSARPSSRSAASLRSLSAASSAISAWSASAQPYEVVGEDLSRASRRSAWMTAARRATAACRPAASAGAAVRRWSCTRARLACIASSSGRLPLRLRCLRTPAASSMKARRPSGSACRTESS